MQPPPPPPSDGAATAAAVPDFDRLLERVHGNLYTIVGEEASRIFHLERAWSKSELTKRVVRYIYNATKSQDLLMLPWEEATGKLVEHAMQGYCGACSDRHWFFELDLTQALCSAAWELARATGQAAQRVGPGPGARYRQLQDVVVRIYEDKLDEALLAKGIWDATRATFIDAALQSKVNRALTKTHAKALEDCLMDSRPLEDLKRVEHFTRRWMDSSMRQVWCAVEGAESTINEGSILRLFQNLTAPFGDHHHYSCIPPVLIQYIGRPPSDWQFLADSAQQVVSTWRQELLRPPAGASKRRRVRTTVASSGGAGEAVPGPPPPPRLALPTAPIEVIDSDDDRGAAGGLEEAEDEPPEGHRECSSAEDCVGGPRDLLVRHLLEGLEGDLYCASCWRGLRAGNPTFEGRWEDGPSAGEAFR